MDLALSQRELPALQQTAPEASFAPANNETQNM